MSSMVTSLLGVLAPLGEGMRTVFVALTIHKRAAICAGRTALQKQGVTSSLEPEMTETGGRCLLTTEGC